MLKGKLIKLPQFDIILLCRNAKKYHIENKVLTL